jgi:hypothetical protein
MPTRFYQEDGMMMKLFAMEVDVSVDGGGK